MKSALLLSLSLTALLAGCVTRSLDLATSHDPFTGLRTDLIVENQLDSGPDPHELLWLNAARVFRWEGGYDYYLEAAYAAHEEIGYLDIGPGRTLTVTVDGRELRFSGLGSKNLRKRKSGVVVERALYLATADDLRAIANGKRVTVTVEGKRGRFARDFGPENTARFKQFVEKYAR